MHIYLKPTQLVRRAARAALVGAFVLIYPVSQLSAQFVLEDFESGHSPGAQPVGADGVAPPENTSLVATEIVTGRDNRAGRGQGLYLAQDLAAGTVGESEKNLGRYGFVTLSQTIGVDYTVDNVAYFAAE